MSSSIARFVPKSSNTSYLSLLDLFKRKVNPSFFERCGTIETQLVRKCVVKNAIPDNDVIFVSKNGVSNSKNTRATPFVTEKYAKDWIFNLDAIENLRATTKKKASDERNEKMKQTRVARKLFDPESLKPLPFGVELDDNEHFRDTDGNVLSIEVRGERGTHESLYFKASDIDKALALASKSVYDPVTQTTGDYVYGLHYVFYKGTLNQGTDVTPQKILYLSYFGVVKYLVCSRSPKAESFQKWAVTTLFAHQFGDEKTKDKLAGNLLGVDYRTIASIFRCSASKIPCVYLFKVGKVSYIQRYAVENDDPVNLTGYAADDIVYKFGRADDLERRTNEHGKTYGKMTDEFSLHTFNYVDKVYASKAETTLQHFFEASDMLVPDKKRVELVVIPKHKLKHVNEMFRNVQTMYAGDSRDLINKMESMQAQHAVEEMRSHHSVEVMRSQHMVDLQQQEIKYLKQIMEIQSKSSGTFD